MTVPFTRALAITALFLSSTVAVSANPPWTERGPVWSVFGSAQRAHTPPFPPSNHGRPVFDYSHVTGGTWQSLKYATPFTANGPGTAILMTDGTVMVNDSYQHWYRLTPDKFGNYVNGTWSSGGTLPAGYAPLYFASAILPDGRLIMNGGEYNEHSKTEVETNLGAIYTPATNTWARVAPPTNWTVLGDAQSVVLANGTYMLGNCCYSLEALLAPGATSFFWQSANNKNDADSEEGWTLLPNGRVLTVDVSSPPNSEMYNPTTDTWSSAGRLPASLINSSEIGPQILRPNGTVFVIGANGLTAIYTLATGRWSAGPKLPVVAGKQLQITDGPASLLPDGNVFFAASPGVYKTPVSFFEFDGAHFIPVNATPYAPYDSTYHLRTLLLPTGQILEDDSELPADIEIYTSRGTPLAGTAPVVTSVPSLLTHGVTYKIAGTKFNGYSQANAFGDDAQMATNFPLVRITNNATGHVFYARTHTFSFMPVAYAGTVSADFDVPKTIELGASTLVVVANGVPSVAHSVTIR